MPIDIEDDNYCHYSTNFKDVGTLKTILDAPDQSPLMLPASPSPVLNTFLENMDLPSQTIFVIYVCAEVCSIYILYVLSSCSRSQGDGLSLAMQDQPPFADPSHGSQLSPTYVVDPRIRTHLTSYTVAKLI